MTDISNVNVYNDTKIDKLSVETELEESVWKQLNKEKYFKNLSLFTLAALIGKYIVKKRTKLIHPNAGGFIRREYLNDNDEAAILKCLAINEVNDIKILVDEKAMYTICEEYANSGIKLLYEWYSDNSIDFGTKLLDVLLNFID